jgi:hypothetical protein
MYLQAEGNQKPTGTCISLGLIVACVLTLWGSMDLAMLGFLCLFPLAK